MCCFSKAASRTGLGRILYTTPGAARFQNDLKQLGGRGSLKEGTRPVVNEQRHRKNKNKVETT
jgi:hypothetical protein